MESFNLTKKDTSALLTQRGKGAFKDIFSPANAAGKNIA